MQREQTAAPLADASRPDPQRTAGGPHFTRSDFCLVAVCGAAVVVTFFVRLLDITEIGSFVLSAVSLALLARLVGRGVEALGDTVGPAVTGVVQSALGNLPELFVALFALNAGLVAVVQSAVVGSILANVLLVLGIAFVVGGLRHGTLEFSRGTAQTIALMLILSCRRCSFRHSPRNSTPRLRAMRAPCRQWWPSSFSCGSPCRSSPLHRASPGQAPKGRNDLPSGSSAAGRPQKRHSPTPTSWFRRMASSTAGRTSSTARA
ncbi:calcium:cation antiporter [Pseudonocardia adelaidensis]|uniref:Sodium/calcium exchanger membrane region domain-containing protein n=1 Tax=Pseudonocardia adelaidensis TaxID=648754 RepID=A0ABP9NMU1_9PSEU